VSLNRTEEQGRVVAQVVAMRPIWEDGPCREALQAFLEEVADAEKAEIDATLEACGYKLSVDPAATRKVEYNATRRDAFRDFLALIDSRVSEAEQHANVRALTANRQ
jgi:hypothetical protein